MNASYTLTSQQTSPSSSIPLSRRLARTTAHTELDPIRQVFTQPPVFSKLRLNRFAALSAAGSPPPSPNPLDRPSKHARAASQHGDGVCVVVPNSTLKQPFHNCFLPTRCLQAEAPPPPPPPDPTPAEALLEEGLLHPVDMVTPRPSSTPVVTHKHRGFALITKRLPIYVAYCMVRLHYSDHPICIIRFTGRGASSVRHYRVSNAL